VSREHVYAARPVPVGPAALAAARRLLARGALTEDTRHPVELEVSWTTRRPAAALPLRDLLARVRVVAVWQVPDPELLVAALDRAVPGTGADVSVRPGTASDPVATVQVVGAGIKLVDHVAALAGHGEAEVELALDRGNGLPADERLLDALVPVLEEDHLLAAWSCFVDNPHPDRPFPAPLTVRLVANGDEELEPEPGRWCLLVDVALRERADADRVAGALAGRTGLDLVHLRTE
jgi:hypothetical protein